MVQNIANVPIAMGGLGKKSEAALASNWGSFHTLISSGAPLVLVQVAVDEVRAAHRYARAGLKLAVFRLRSEKLGASALSALANGRFVDDRSPHVR